MVERGPAPDAATHVIVGAGWLAALLAPLLAGQRVFAVRRSARPALPGVTALTADVTRAGDVAALAPRLGTAPLAVYLLLPPSAIGERNAAAAFAPLVALLRRRALRRVVLVSSSGVYADDAHPVVDAATPVGTAGSARVRRLLAIEQAWRDSGLALSVVRLAGLYGPGRIVGRRSILDGATLPGSGAAWLNLIRGEDAARGLAATMRHPRPPHRVLLSDGRPVRRADYYGHLAGLLGAPSPRFADAAAPGAGGRRCDPRASWCALGLVPRYPDYRTGLRDLIRE